MAVSPEQFRKVLSQFATGVTIITLKNQDGLHGLTVNAFSAVSLEPPLILICIQKNGASHAALSQAGQFVVNILSAGQRALAERFASSKLDGEQRFQGVHHRPTQNGHPVLNNTLGYLECRIADEIAAGDHVIFLGQVEQAAINTDSARPLLFFNSQFHTLNSQP
jgi:flavin reductase (DIM6/NTAB) family NADH-FMN oxidoreductase RutF